MAKDLTFTVDVPLPVQRVWAAFTTDVGLQEWWWPMFDDVDYRFDPTPGAYYAIRSDSRQLGVHGQVQEATGPSQGSPAHLAYTWIWDTSGDEQNPDRVSVNLTGNDEASTHVQVVHHLQDDADAEPIAEGWHDCLDRLVALR